MSGDFKSQEILSLDHFIEWLTSTCLQPHTSAISPDLDCRELFDDDDFARLAFATKFDELTADRARPRLGLFECASVRELYLHYLYVMSAPLEGDSHDGASTRGNSSAPA